MGEDKLHEEQVEYHDEPRNSQIHPQPVDGAECHGVLPLEEICQCDKRTCKGGNVTVSVVRAYCTLSGSHDLTIM